MSMGIKEKGFMAAMEDERANLRARLVVVENFCYACPFVKKLDKKAKSGKPICKCDHPVLLFRDPSGHPVLDPDHAFIPREKCPLQEGAWTVELHPRDRRIAKEGSDG